MKWNDLDMFQRSQLMQIFIQNGITDLNQMKSIYDNGGKRGKKPIYSVAHQVNKLGNSPSDKPRTYEQFSGTCRTEHAQHPYAPRQVQYDKDVRSRYEERYGKPDKYNWKIYNSTEYQAIKEQVLKDRYQDYLKQFNSNTVPTNSQLAAGMAVYGSGTGLIPTPATRAVGTLLTIPDQIFDWAAALDEPKPSNAAHVAVDYAPYLAKAIPGKYDDIILNGLNLLGNVDDAASAADNNMFKFLDNLNSNENSEGGSYKDGGGFKKWRRKMSKYKGIDMKHDPDYDYKGFFEENPEYAWSMLDEDPSAHFSDKYKRPSHPTFSDESIYSQQYQQEAGNPDWINFPMGGYWDKDSNGNDVFYHSYFTSSTPEKIKRTADYIRKNEPMGVRAIFEPEFGAPVLPTISIEDHPEYSKSEIKAINMGLQYIPKPMQEMIDKVDSVNRDHQQRVKRSGQDYDKRFLASPKLSEEDLSKMTDIRSNPRMASQLMEYYNTFLEAGYTPVQAAAVLGNALQENDTMAFDRIGLNNAYGIYQMEEPEYQLYKKWLKKNKLKDTGVNQTKYIASVYNINSDSALTPEEINNGDINTSKIYTRHPEAAEVYGGYNRDMAIQDWKTDNIGNATRAFMSTYEKPGNPMLQKRMHYANEIYKMFYGQ